MESLEERTTLPNINVTARSTTRRSRGSSKGSSLTSEDDDDRIMFDGASWVRQIYDYYNMDSSICQVKQSYLDVATGNFVYCNHFGFDGI